MAQTIKHVVVLMLENRSFDHVFGFMRTAKYPIDGLTGDESNPLDPHHASTEIKVSRKAEYVLTPDPGHTLSDVNVQIYARPEGPPGSVPPNRGFILDYGQESGVTPATAPTIMRCFAPSRLPVITRLAREFAICDRWFSSVPGPTWPNRFFAHCATSKGFIDNSPFHNYDMPTIFERLAERGFTWNVYFHDVAHSIFHRTLAREENVVNFLAYRGFARNARNGTLASYSFIEPRYFNGLKRANDQHPPHDMLLGETLIAEVYEALRSSSAWNETLLLIVYDEHGGTYDHVEPPAAAPPDEHTGQFAFDRYGVRVPAVIVSPFVPKGKIVREMFDHASIPATLRDVFGLGEPLTARDANAASFKNVASLASPRTDTPKTIQRGAKSPSKAIRSGRQGKPRQSAPSATPLQPLSGFQRSLLDAAHDVLAKDASPQQRALAPITVRSERTVGIHVTQLMAERVKKAKRRAAPIRKRNRPTKSGQ